MPRFAALIKITNCRALGATVILHGADLSEARATAEALAIERNLVFVHPFDNLDVIAGQGTMALEILEQTPTVEAIVTPVGGGGLIAGIGTAVKALRAEVRIVGVEADHAACLAAARPRFTRRSKRFVKTLRCPSKWYMGAWRGGRTPS